ncbi:unnamed protein product [Thelazia callipaeda]|uniref:BPI2 domain-containing protein n=1 Tax=Thelazia callipaeda TaxID=103827 RepID=A0A0N5D996_THECL|nr:unnamed protein product [Thelazia callipaeda]
MLTTVMGNRKLSFPCDQLYVCDLEMAFFIKFRELSFSIFKVLSLFKYFTIVTKQIAFSNNVYELRMQVLLSTSDYLFKKRTEGVVIAPQESCFPEGCVSIKGLRIIAHRNPSRVEVLPRPPNQIMFRIIDFDFHIAGTLFGQINPLLLIPITLPIYGILTVSARQLGIEAIFDIQKTTKDIPFIRMISCDLFHDFVLARIENMGLLTEIVNAKYQQEMTAKARKMLQDTLCNTVNNVIHNEMNSRLSEIPRKLSVDNLFAIFFEKSEDFKGQKKKRALKLESNHLPVYMNSQNISDAQLSNEFELIPSRRPFSIGSQYGSNIHQTTVNSRPFSAFNNQASQKSPETNITNSTWQDFLRKLAFLIISLSILDTSATLDKFFIGFDGNVNFGVRDRTEIPYKRPERLRFPGINDENNMDLLISEYTINTLFLKAHEIGALKFNISSTTPTFGNLLRTTCTLDEICMSDVVPEIGERYPNEHLEIILSITEPPKAVISTGSATITLKGHATIFVRKSSKEIGSIPFSSKIQCNISTSHHRIFGNFLCLKVCLLAIKLLGSAKVIKLDFAENTDFLGLLPQSLNGLRETIKRTLTNLMSQKLKTGLDLKSFSFNRLSNISFSLVDDAILFQANFNIERSFY